ncbi:glycosyltransferase [Desulfococcaceae bacterium HSG8]|nr:glycosyltransferase [Desulfococcaceae bacterium HSG8]
MKTQRTTDNGQQTILSIVFLNYNRLAETRETAEHLQPLVEEREDTEVIAVNNGSSDGTRAYLRTQEHWLTVVNLGQNTGIAGLNEGFRLTRGKYVLVLDDDSHPHDSATLDRVIACLDARPGVGAVACRIESPDNQPVRTWHLAETDFPGPSLAFVGCGFAIRRDLFESIGWFPDRFFLYQNEIEVAIRLMRKGFGIHYDPLCRVVHRESPAGRAGWRRVYFPTRNTIWIIRHYFPFPPAAYLIASRLCMGLFRAIQYRELKWYCKSVRDAFGEPIKPEVLPLPLRKKLNVFWKQNSLWHQLNVRTLLKRLRRSSKPVL